MRIEFFAFLVWYGEEQALPVEVDGHFEIVVVLESTGHVLDLLDLATKSLAHCWLLVACHRSGCC